MVVAGCFSSHCQKMSKVGKEFECNGLPFHGVNVYIMRRERLCMLLGMNLTRVKGSAFETGLT